MSLDEKAIARVERLLQEMEMPDPEVERYNRDIEEAEAQVERGEFFSQEQMRKLSGKW